MRYSKHIDSQGQAFFEQSCRLSFEGNVCKRGSSPYHPGRGKQWVKVKCANYEEFVVGGYTDPGGSRSGFGSLLMGTFDANGGYPRRFVACVKTAADLMALVQAGALEIHPWGSRIDDIEPLTISCSILTPPRK